MSEPTDKPKIVLANYAETREEHERAHPSAPATSGVSQEAKDAAHRFLIEQQNDEFDGTLLAFTAEHFQRAIYSALAPRDKAHQPQLSQVRSDLAKMAEQATAMTEEHIRLREEVAHLTANRKGWVDAHDKAISELSRTREDARLAHIELASLRPQVADLESIQQTLSKISEIYPLASGEPCGIHDLVRRVQEGRKEALASVSYWQSRTGTAEQERDEAREERDRLGEARTIAVTIAVEAMILLEALNLAWGDKFAPSTGAQITGLRRRLFAMDNVAARKVADLTKQGDEARK